MDEILNWLAEIKDAQKRDKEFRDKGKKILKIYEGENTPFNVLYSNTETLLPALFSQPPKPVISRRFKDDDPIGKVVSEAGQRMLEYLVDTDIDEYDNFTDSLTDVALDGLLPGRGNLSIKYESDDDVSWETVCPDAKDWSRVYYGYAKKWSKVPWIAYEEHLDEGEAKRLFKAKSKELNFTEGEDEEKTESNENKGKRKTALVYQIWDKKSRSVKYVSPQYVDGYLREDEDPLGLSGFFNCPKPLQFVKKPSNLVPTALYTLYENQAEELNRIQGRINKIVEAIKARGIYDGTLGDDLENLFKEADNALVPTDKTSSLVDGGLDKAIWFAPVEKLIIVLQELYKARQSCKSVIYEITGISDIVRGQSVASETLGAQKIKESWGTMRLKRLQKEVQRYALDMMKIMLEISATKFSEETWKKATMLPNPLTEEKEQAQAQIKMMQTEYQQKLPMLQQQAMIQAQQTGKQPQVPPFNPDPKLMKIVSMPSWGEILEILKDDFHRSYRLDIETNSTLDVEATEDKQMIGEFMNALGQVMAGFSNDQSIPFAAKKSIILAVTKRFRFGREVEDELKTMQEPKPQIPPELQKKMKEQQQQIQKAQQKIKAEQEQLEKEKQKLEFDKQQQDFKKQMDELSLKHKEELAKQKSEIGKSKIIADIEKVMEKRETKMQSLIDKAVSRIELQNKKAS